MQRLVNDVVRTRRISLSYEDPPTTSQVVSKEGLQKKQRAKKKGDAKTFFDPGTPTAPTI